MTSLSEIKDQVLNAQNVPCSVILSGNAGIGKSELAKELASRLLDVDIEHLETHADYSSVTPNAETATLAIGVGQIRSMSNHLHLSPVGTTKRRVAIVFQSETMTIQAGNSLLKTLEEPPRNTTIILVTSQLGSLLPTLRSRCAIFKVSNPDRESAKTLMLQQDPEIKPADIDMYLSLANNSPGLALSLMDIKAGSAYKSALMMIANFAETGTLPRSKIQNFAKTYAGKESWVAVSEMIALIAHRTSEICLFGGLKSDPAFKSEEKYLKAISDKVHSQAILQLWIFLTNKTSQAIQSHLDAKYHLTSQITDYEKVISPG